MAPPGDIAIKAPESGIEREPSDLEIWMKKLREIVMNGGDIDEELQKEFDKDLKDDPKHLFRDLLKMSEPDIATPAVEFVNRKAMELVSVRLLAEALRNPFDEVRTLAAKGIIDAGPHAVAGLLTDFIATRNPDNAVAIVLALPPEFPIPEKVVNYLLETVDQPPELVNALMFRTPGIAFELTEKTTKDATDIMDRVRELNKKSILQKLDDEEMELLDEWRNSLRGVHDDATAAALEEMISAGKGTFKIDGSPTDEKLQKLFEALKDNGDGKLNPEDFVNLDIGKETKIRERLAESKIDTGDIDLFIEFLRSDDGKTAAAEFRDTVFTNETLKVLLGYDDLRYYREFLKVAEDITLTPAMKRRGFSMILREAIMYEAMDGAVLGAKRLASLVWKHAIKKKAEAAAEFVKKAGEKVMAIATGVLAAAPAVALTGAALSAVDSASVPQTTTESVRAYIPTIANEPLRGTLTVATFTPEDDGSVSTIVDKQKVHIRVDKTNGMEIYVVAKDGKKLPVNALTLDGIEQTGVVTLPLYEYQKQWDKSGRGDQVLAAVYGINFGDNKMASKDDREKFAKSVLNLPKQFRESLKIFKSFGVLDDNYVVNDKRGRRVHQLFTYLELHIGLENVKRNDLENIAEVWELTKMQELMTPQTAARRLETLAAKPA